MGEGFYSGVRYAVRRTEERAARTFAQQFGRTPSLIASAPGRVNLIGEHTDYNDGFVLPCAVDRRVAVALSPGSGRLYSDDFHEARTLDERHDGSWADYPRGVVWALSEAGSETPRWDGAFAGDVPLGSGLSSSAAIEAATALSLDRLAGLDLPRTQLALLCQRAENAYVGVNSGIMDQYASLLCQQGAALLIDCRTLESTSVPLRLAPAGLVLLVTDTRVERGLGTTAYNERRAACERAARELGVRALRDATESQLSLLSGDDLKRARHVVTEDARVLAAVDALREDDFRRLGELMIESHRSLRDDYEVSIPQLDTAVEAALDAGALGARLTGAGFGGCAVAVAPAERVDGIRARTTERFAERGFSDPEFYTFEPAAGAEVVADS
jgi:galactokinase